jgi:membrane protein implicated in regulation of membrane protease activity
MSGSESVFVATGVIGFVVLLASLLLGEFAGHEAEVAHELELSHDAEFGHDAELGHGVEVEHAGGDLHSPSWLSTKVIAASLVGFGATGFIAASAGAPAFASWPVAAAGLVAVGAGALFLVLKPLSRQQYNSLMSRYNYVGMRAVVTLEIEAGGSGQVTFRDRQGARVNQTARADHGEAVAKGSPVEIVDLAPGGVIVHYNQFSL